MTQDRLNLSDLKAQSPKDLLSMAEELEIENASTMRKGRHDVLDPQGAGRRGLDHRW